LNKYNTDYLSIMPDDDVFNALNTVKRKINELSNGRKNPNLNINDLQVEYCYLNRETSLRKVRKAKHEEYLAQLFKTR